MSARLARLALRLYPLSYRRRYGDEMEALLEDDGATPGAVLDLFRGAIGAHLRPEPALAATVDRDERLRRGLAAELICWLLFAVAGLAFYKTTEGVPFESVPATPGALDGIHLAIQLLAAIGGAAVLIAAGAISAVAAGTRAAGRRLLAAEAPRRALATASVCAVAAAAAMVGIAALTAAYLIALATGAPHLAGEPNGPFGTPDVAVSLAIQLVAMILVAAPATLVAVRTWRIGSAR